MLLVGSSIMQGAVFSLVNFFDSYYMTATVSGQALGGIIAALAQILALWWGASSVHSAFIYFLFADVFILFSLVLYAILVKTVSIFFISLFNFKHKIFLVCKHKSRYYKKSMVFVLYFLLIFLTRTFNFFNFLSTILYIFIH